MSQKISMLGKWIASAAVAFALASTASAGIITFEELSLGVSGDGSTAYGTSGYYWNGSSKGVGHEDDSFTTAGASFVNSYYSWGGWDGFAYSNVVNTTTPGFGNQYSAITGGGVDGASDNYAVGYSSFDGDWSITYSEPVDMAGGGLYVTNTTYTYLTIQNGNGFADPFEDGDWFRLSITGSLAGDETGTVDFYLADFRFGATDIVNQWTFVDLSSLTQNGPVDKLTFELASSDVGEFGINTPTYIAIDNVTTVPEPSALVLTAVAFGMAALRRRRISTSSI